MTPFWRGLKTSGRMQKHGKIEKVTGFQDDAFLEGTKQHLIGCKKHERTEKGTGSQDDGFLEGAENLRSGDPPQCRKWRTPGKTMAKPSLSAESITF